MIRRASSALSALAALTLLSLATQTAHAQSQDATLVLSHGGVEQLDIIDLIQAPQGQPQLLDLGQLRIFSAQEGPKTLEDLRTLPDGRVLLGGISKRGVIIVDPLDLDNPQPLYQSPDTFSQLSTIAVANYGAFGTPTRVIFADSRSAIISIYDTQDAAVVRREGVFINGGRASFAQSILMPQNRLASATNWSALGIYAIDILDLGAQGGPSLTRFSNTTHADQPAQTFTRDFIQELRDLIALDADTLLVTTRFSVFAMTTSGELLWRLNVEEDEALSGELASARVTPGGKLVIASFEPGQWTQPHPNHRIHWFALSEDPKTPPTRITQTGPLSRAPRRIEPYHSTGGTGTLGYTAGLDTLPSGEVSQLSIKTALAFTGVRLRPDDTVDASVTFINEGQSAIGVKQLAIVATEGTRCDDPTLPLNTLISSGPRIIEPGAEYALKDQLSYDQASPFKKPGTWCAQAAAQDADGQWFTFGQEVLLDIVEGDKPGPKPLPYDDLNLSQGDMDHSADMGADMAAPTPGAKPNPDDGCGCTSTKRPPLSGALGALLALSFALFTHRRRRER